MRTVASVALVLVLGWTNAFADPPWGEKLFETPTDKKDLKSVDAVNVDFGNIPRGTQLSHRFLLNNIYAVPLEVSTRIGCTCVTITNATKTLQPRDKGSIDIVMDSRKFAGIKKVNIFVTVSAPQFFSTATLTITANSRSDVVLNPGQFTFGVVSRGQKSAVQTLDVEYAGALNWQITELVKHTAPIDASFSELYRRPGQVGYRVSVAVNPDAPAGTLRHELYLKTNDPATPLIPILIEGTVQASLTVAPNPVSLGTLKVGESVTKLVAVRGSRPFRVTAAEGQGDGLTAELPVAAGNVQYLKVKCQPTKAGEIHRELRIKTDLEQEGPVSVQVNGVVEP